MPIRPTITCAVALAMSALLCASAIPAQVIHLPPHYRQALPKGTVLISIKLEQQSQVQARTPAPPAQPTGVGDDVASDNDDQAGAATSGQQHKDGTTAAPDVSVAIQDDQLIISRVNKPPHVIALRDRAIRDVVAEIRQTYGDTLDIFSEYPLYQASLLKSTTGAEKLSVDRQTTLVADSDEPDIDVNFGFILALSSTADKQQQGLLSQAGFQLDVIGVHELLGPGRVRVHKQPGWRPLLFVQTRLGLNANQQLNVQSDAGEGVDSQTASQFDAALEQADQVAVTSQVDVVLPLWDDHTDFIVTPLYGVSWTRLDPFTLPAALTSAAKNAEDASRLDQAVADMGRTLPLSEFGLTGLFQFRHDGRPLFFFGGGYTWKEDIRRTFTYDTTSTGEPDFPSIKSDLGTPMVRYWTAQFGARIAGVLDVRLDAAGPIGKRNGEPLLRVMLGRAFPITQ